MKIPITLAAIVGAGFLSAAIPSAQAGPAPASGCGSPGAVIVGTPANDILVGTPGDDVIRGLGGDDVSWTRRQRQDRRRRRERQAPRRCLR